MMISRGRSFPLHSDAMSRNSIQSNDAPNIHAAEPMR